MMAKRTIMAAGKNIGFIFKFPAAFITFCFNFFSHYSDVVRSGQSEGFLQRRPGTTIGRII